MKRFIQIMVFPFAILLTGCEKEGKDLITIMIETSKKEYFVNSKILVTIKNDLNKQATHFKCDNVDLVPTKILKKENGRWIENEYPVVCTQMGPMGYFGLLNIAETKHDSITLLNSIGRFKLRYRFLIDNDYMDFDSNEFLLYGSEL